MMVTATMSDPLIALYGSSGTYALGDDDYNAGSFSTVTAVSVPKGEPWYGSDNAEVLWSANVHHSAGVPSDIPARIIAGGVQITDATPEFYRGGMIRFAQGSSSAEQVAFNTVRKLSATNTGFMPNVTVFRGLPPTATVMAQQHDSRSFRASDGIYAVFDIDTEGNHYEQPVQNGLCFTAGRGDRGLMTDITSPAVDGDYARPSSAVHRAHIRPQLIALTGLNDNAVINFESLIISEIAPTLDSVELNRTSEAAMYDPRALILYRQIKCDLPWAVPVGDNPTSKWWGRVLQKVGSAATAAAPFAAVIPGYGSAISTGIGAAGGALTAIGKAVSGKAQAQPKPVPKPKRQRTPAKFRK
jgi:hypothetical protein